MAPWKILGIEPTGDEREIRRAYARQLKTRQHENDPDYFARLRQAYEWALACAQQPAVQVQPVQITENVPAETPLSPEIEENKSNASAGAIVSYSYSYQINLIPGVDISPATHDSFVRAAKTKKADDELENMLREIDEIFTESLHLKPVKKKRKRLYRIWEEIRIHPRLDTLDGRELFSERIALLLAKHCSGSRLLWQETRNFFGWQYPVLSDCSLMAHSLRKLFQGEDEREESSTKSKAKILFSSGKMPVRRNTLIWMFILFVLIGFGQIKQNYPAPNDLPFSQSSLSTLAYIFGYDEECFKKCMDGKLHENSTPSSIILEACKKCKQQNQNPSLLVSPKGRSNPSDIPQTPPQTHFTRPPRFWPAPPP